MKSKLLAAVVALLACSGAWASDVTYKCVVEHRLGIDMSQMQPARFKIDHEYRIETVESYLEKTDGGDPHDFDMPASLGNHNLDSKYTYAVRRTDKDPSDHENWAVLEDFDRTWDYEGAGNHFRMGVHGVIYFFEPDDDRMVVTSYTGAHSWRSGYNTHDPYTDFTTCTAHYD